VSLGRRDKKARGFSTTLRERVLAVTHREKIVPAQAPQWAGLGELSELCA